MTNLLMKRTGALWCLGLAMVAMVAMVLSVSTPLAASGFHAEHKLSAVAVASSLTQQDGTTTAKFVVQVSNDDEAAITNFKVVFSEDFSVAVGDVAAGAKAASGGQTIAVDTSGAPTQSLALPVTYQFEVDGVATEMAALLTFVRAE